MSKVSIGIDVESNVIRDYYLSIRKSWPTDSFTVLSCLLPVTNKGACDVRSYEALFTAFE